MRKKIKLLDLGAPNLSGHFKDGVIKACDEVRGKRRGGEEKVLDGYDMPAEWALVRVVPTFKGKGDIRNCSCY